MTVDSTVTANRLLPSRMRRKYGDSLPAVKSTVTKKHMRADIQALRAFAVVAVVINHMWPHLMPGGYVGVDIFFVISGFLITFPLTRDLARYGRVKLVGFYGRRVRRLLPAAAAVIVASVLGMAALMPHHLWRDNVSEALASLFYGENIYLMVLSRDYHAQGQQASLFQHYWSLSVEEQFYFVWPLLLMLAFWVSFRFRGNFQTTEVARKHSAWRGPLVAVTVLSVASFWWALPFGSHYPHQAYFFTLIRAWEFGVGATVALLVQMAHERQLRWLPYLHGMDEHGLLPWARVAFSLTGWAMMFASLWLVTSEDVFPGPWTLLPTFGAGLVLLAGAHVRHSPGEALWQFKPIRLTGDISYSIYLWHWPLMVLLPYMGSTANSRPGKLVLLVVMYLVATASKFWIEDRAMAWSFWKVSNRRTFSILLAVMAAAALSGWGLLRAADHLVARDQQALSASSKVACPNPVIGSGERCADPSVAVVSATIPPSELYSIPDVRQQVHYDVAADDANYYWKSLATNPRIDAEQDWQLFTPEGGQVSEGFAGVKRVLLVGDSHAEELLNAVIPWASARHWDLDIFRSAGCALPASGYQLDTADRAYVARCASGSKKLDELLSQQSYDLIIYRAETRALKLRNDRGEVGSQVTREGLEARLKQFAQQARYVLVPTDTPLNSLNEGTPGPLRDPACLASNLSDPRACALPRKIALPSDLPVEIVREFAHQSDTAGRVAAVDLTDVFCDSHLCYAATGGVPFYFDAGHISRSTGRKMSQVLQQRGEQALGLK